MLASHRVPHFRKACPSRSQALASCVSTGFQRTKTEVVRIVHVGVSTIAMRLREFTGTESGTLTFAQLKVTLIWPSSFPMLVAALYLDNKLPPREC